MSMLARYRKQQNGFEQLLHLLESSNNKKKETFFRLIDQEDPSWGALLRTKLLSLDRFFTWEDSIVKIAIGMLPSRLVAIALHDSPELIEKAKSTMSELRQEEVDFELSNGNFTEAQRDSAQATMIKKIRELIKTGQINLESVDPGLVYRNEAA